MTAEETDEGLYAGEEVDHIPYTLQAPDPAMADIFGFTTTQFAKDFEVKSEVIRRRKEEFGLDSFNVGLGLKTIGGALGVEACRTGAWHRTMWQSMCYRIMRILTNWKSQIPIRIRCLRPSWKARSV